MIKRLHMKNYYLKMALFLSWQESTKSCYRNLWSRQQIMSRNYEWSFPVSNSAHYNLRDNSTFRIPSFNTIFKEKKSVSFFVPKLWNQVPEEIKSLESLTSFKKAIKKWVPPRCQCRLCRTFLNNVGFISKLFWYWIL